MGRLILYLTSFTPPSSDWRCILQSCHFLELLVSSVTTTNFEFVIFTPSNSIHKAIRSWGWVWLSPSSPSGRCLYSWAHFKGEVLDLTQGIQGGVVREKTLFAYKQIANWNWLIPWGQIHFELIIKPQSTHFPKFLRLPPHAQKRGNHRD